AALFPGQKAIIASGFSETDRVKRLLELGACAYVRKPYTMETLGRAVREALDR
ncbi:MAG: response regulator transcription factor, partial [Desulfatitalea sp.]|nr:response regulator transcription factor [Desulfatitalea sp.]